MLTIKEMVNKDKRSEIAIIISFCLMGISDPFLFNLSYKNLMFLLSAPLGARIYKAPIRTVDNPNEITKSILGEFENKCPETLLKKIQILKIGNKCFESKKRSVENRIKIVPKAVCAFVVLAICISSIFFSAVNVTEVIYVEDRIWKKSSEFQRIKAHKWREYAKYLSEDDVKEIRANNGIVRGYKDSGEPMYAYYGNIARMEYIRNGVSIGVWGSALIIVVWSILNAGKEKDKQSKREEIIC